MAIDDDRGDVALRAELEELRALVTELEHRDEARKRTEQALIDSRNTLQMVTDTIPQRVFWKDRRFHYLGCNAIFARDAGVSSPDEIVGKHDFDLPWRQSAPAYRSDDQLVMEGREAKVNYEEPMLMPDGSLKWLRTTKVPLLDHRGEVIGVFGCYEDITERRRAEDGLRESEERYRTLIEQAADGIFVSEAEGSYVQVNTAACEMTGYDRSELEAMRVDDLVLPQDVGERPLRMDLVRQGVPVVCERRLRRKDGSLLHAEVSSKMLSDGHIQAIVRDISERQRADRERRRLEEELRHSQRLESLGRLAGGVAHDFNNLLTAILTNCDILQMRLEREGIESRELAQIQRAGRRAATLTGQLLSFSRKQVIQPRVVDLNEIVRDTQGMLARLIGEDVDLEVRLEPGECLVEADPGQLDQILVNLVVNARDAIRDGGKVVIETGTAQLGEAELRGQPDVQPGPFAILTVTDDGEGMDADTLEHLFEPFFTTKEQGKGTGLGLATVYGIVRRAGGIVAVETAPGEGSSLRVCLPESDGPVERSQPGLREPGRDGAGRTILLVEDDESVRESAERILTDAGYEVLAATDGQDALRVYDAHGGIIHLLVTDVVMPRMGGPELADVLRRRAPTLKMLFVTGYTDDSLGERGVLSPDVELLNKPFSRGPFLDRVREVLGS